MTFLPRLTALLICSLLAAGCSSLAHFPVNPPIERVEQAEELRIRPHVDHEILLTITFSGGGSRASAFAYGVLEELHATINPRTGQNLLGELDLISAVSGGSITAAYYGLYGDRLFSEFREGFLERDMAEALKSKLLSPATMTKLQSGTYGTGDVLDEFFREQLFGESPLSELLDDKGPLVEINATDLFKGGRFGFTSQQFHLICSDAGGFPRCRSSSRR
jgi:NTE family protein